MNAKSCTGLSPKPWKRLLSGLFIATSALMMTACAQLTTPSQDGPAIPPNLMQPCRQLSPLEGKTGADLTRKLVEVGKAYNECADGKRQLIDALQNVGNHQ